MRLSAHGFVTLACSLRPEPSEVLVERHAHGEMAGSRCNQRRRARLFAGLLVGQEVAPIGPGEIIGGPKGGVS